MVGAAEQFSKRITPWLVLRVDESLGCAIGGVDEVDVVGWAAWGVDCEDGEGVFEDAQGVDYALAEEDELAGGDLTERVFSDGNLGSAGEDVEVLVATGVIVRGYWMVDAEDAAACGVLVG